MKFRESVPPYLSYIVFVFVQGFVGLQFVNLSIYIIILWDNTWLIFIYTSFQMLLVYLDILWTTSELVIMGHLFQHLYHTMDPSSIEEHHYRFLEFGDQRVKFFHITYISLSRFTKISFLILHYIFWINLFRLSTIQTPYHISHIFYNLIIISI